MQVPRAETFTARTIAIVNPYSGNDDKDRTLRAIRAWFADPAHPGEVREVRSGEDIADAARRAATRTATENRAGEQPDAQGTTIIAVGGDGTISTVAEALAGTGAALGVVPAGTFNYFARGLGIPEDVDAALDAIASGTARPVDLGRINGRVFLNNASIGIYSRIRRQRERTYRRFGRSRVAAYWSVLRAMLQVYRPMKLRLTVDGQSRDLRSSLVFVCASAYQIEQFGMEGAEAIRDGKLAVFISRDRGRWQLIAQAIRLALHGMQKGRDFELVTGHDITLETARRHQHIVRDGETGRMRGPFRITLDKGALDVVMPALPARDGA